MNQQEKLEIQREKIESQLKQEFENTRQRFQLEIAKLQTTLKSKYKKITFMLYLITLIFSQRNGRTNIKRTVRDSFSRN